VEATKMRTTILFSNFHKWKKTIGRDKMRFGHFCELSGKERIVTQRALVFPCIGFLGKIDPDNQTEN
jgi:hypothetical protein